MARAGVHAYLEEFEQAIPLIRRAMALRPTDGWPVAQLGYALERLGCPEQARMHYERAYTQGFLGARYRLESMDSPGKGLLPPGRAPLRKAGFLCPS
jgi:hypothetical protein